MKTILVPIDFSKLSDVAVYYAVGMAKEINASILLLHVINGVASHPTLNNWKKLDQEMVDEAQVSAIQLLDQINAKHGIVDISYSYTFGFPVYDAVETIAITHKVDFIIIGSKGTTGLAKTFLGTQASSIVNNSSVPVIVVPGEVNYKRIKKIVYASDMQDLVNEAKSIAQFAFLLEAPIEVLHVVANPNDDLLLSDGKRQSLEKELIKDSGFADIHLHIKYDKDIADGVEKFVLDQHADLLVMFTHRLDFYEKLFGKSITRQVSFHNDVPLLTFNKTNRLG